MKKIVLALLIFIFSVKSSIIFAQQKKTFTLDDIHNGLFRSKSVMGLNWMKDGQFYTAVDNEKNIVKYEVKNGIEVATIAKWEELISPETKKPIEYTGYEFSDDETKILFSTETENIYRHSTKSIYYVYDTKAKSLKRLAKGKQMNAIFSPDGSKVAFCRDNNLFFVNLENMFEKQITISGEINKIINGSTDWVYEEEFAFTQAFFWSPESNKIAYYTFDESAVKEYNMQKWGSLYPVDYKFKYPKAGEKNSVVKISVYNVNISKNTIMDIGTEKDIYIPRIKWTNDNNLLSIKRMNRLQNKLEILHADANTGMSTIVWAESSNTYVDLEFTDDLTYLAQNKGFIQSSEKSGYKHLYLFDMTGKPIRQITTGNWEVKSFFGLNEKNQTLFFTSTEISPLETRLYSINISGKDKKKLTSSKGVHRPSFSNDLQYYIDYYSSADGVLKVSLHKANGMLIKALEENHELKNKIDQYAVGKKEFIKVPLPNGEKLNAYMIKPYNFDANKKYPVLMHVYGGPGSQQVLDIYSNIDWMQALTEQGYIIACVDNRGTGARGKEFRTITYANLGKSEVQDQIDAAKYFGTLTYVDKNRIGINGWSYGGYMSALCLTIGSDVFKAGIVGAPVTNWRFYDTIYTERYLKTPQENPDGYDNFSPLNHAEKLKGKMLLIHGTGDDNVHFQNSVMFVDALVKAGKQFEVFYYPNQTHGVRGYSRVHMDRLMMEFVLKNL